MPIWPISIETTGLVIREQDFDIEAKDSREAAILALMRFGEFKHGETLHFVHIGKPRSYP